MLDQVGQSLLLSQCLTLSQDDRGSGEKEKGGRGGLEKGTVCQGETDVRDTHSISNSRPNVMQNSTQRRPVGRRHARRD